MHELMRITAHSSWGMWPEAAAVLDGDQGLGAGRRPDRRRRPSHVDAELSASGLGRRLRVDELASHYEINKAAVHPTPTTILLIDDVLTAGTHFKAMQKVLLSTFPNASISGAFIARRVFPNPFAAVDE